MTGWEALLAGALLGAGVAVVAAGLVPTQPDLAAVLARLDRSSAPEPAGRGAGAIARMRRHALPRVIEALGLRRFAAELAVTEQTVESLAARKLGYAVLGLTFPIVMAALLALLGVTAAPILPVGVGVVAAGALSLVPDAELRRRAEKARAAMRRAACVYLELVALERAADAGATEALERAATVGRSREFQRIREALLTAQVTGRPAWDGLYRLADQTGVLELSDLADIMRLSGTDGAAVYGTLRARATSLRTQLLASTAADANAASEHMTIPVALLGVAFMALIAFPAFARIFTG